MNTYCSIIQKIMSPKSDVTFNDDNFYKKNVSEILLSIHQNVLGSKEETTSIYNMETELNKLNLYSLLARLIIMQKNELDTISDFLNEKYKFLSSIFENVFYNDANKELFLSEFSKVQRIYFTLSKFARICKYKKSIVRINTDLYINELDESMKNVFVLYEDGSRYFFSATDLVNIMNSSLSHTYMFFSEPLKPKNPYNNIPFNKSTLYNIYFFMKNCAFIMPQLFHQYFICNFDIKLFKSENECLIRDFSIKRYVYSSNYDTLYDNVIIMISDIKKRNRKYKQFMNIDDDFPQKKLVDIMRPYLHLYYLSKYYVTGTEKKNDSMEKLMNKFDLFVRFNPQFGRKVVKIQRIPHKKVTIEYNDKHMNFYKQYPKSAFPKLPTFVDIDNNNHYYDSPVSTYESMFNTSIFQRVLVSRVNHRRNIESIYTSLMREEIFSSSDDEDIEEESIVENDGEEDIVEEDTTDDSDSVS
jgi:hypothetical protein